MSRGIDIDIEFGKRSSVGEFNINTGICIVGIKVNGRYVNIVDRVANISIPTRLSELDNDIDIVKSVNGVTPDEMGNVNIETGIADAPYDDKQYARKNGQWTVVTGGPGGTSDYNDLENKPTINGRELVGDQTGDDLGLYTFPDNGIPESDLDADVVAKLNSRTVATFEYGVSRFEDILAAYNAGKVCELDFDGYKYRLGFIAHWGAAFVGVDYDEMYNGFVYTCLQNNTWQTTEANYASNSYVETKQDIISDLATIRSNAATGAAIAPKVPSQASPTNQLADKAFVNSSIQNVAAYYITKDAAGNPFATKAELLAATTFYSGGQVRVPTRNDYLVVLADESKTIAETGENPTTRYIYDNDVWSYQYIVNRSGLTAAQWSVLQSNITAALVEKLTSLPDAEALTTLFAGKVDKESGKGLSANDYTDDEKTKVANAEQTANKVTALSASSTDTQYPSAKCVYDLIGNVESLLNALL